MGEREEMRGVEREREMGVRGGEREGREIPRPGGYHPNVEKRVVMGIGAWEKKLGIWD